jgi:transcriptional regulator with XRE-family HTH domain
MLCNTLRKAREACGMSQKELAEIVETHPTRISRIEAGGEMLGFDKTAVYARALRVEQKLLVEGAAQAMLDREGLRFKVRVTKGRPQKNMAQQMKRERQDRGLSLLDVATALGVSRPRVVEIERGDKVMKISSAMRLASALGAPKRQILQMALQDAVNNKCGGTFLVEVR